MCFFFSSIAELYNRDNTATSGQSRSQESLLEKERWQFRFHLKTFYSVPPRFVARKFYFVFRVFFRTTIFFLFSKDYDGRHAAVGALSAPMDTIFVKHVKDRSPAKAAGLQCGDRLVGVNRVAVTDKTYAQVVQLIQNSPEYLHLLVVPKEDDILQRVSSAFYCFYFWKKRFFFVVFRRKRLQSS